VFCGSSALVIPNPASAGEESVLLGAGWVAGAIQEQIPPFGQNGKL
jgi:hypothetical protein